MPAAMTALVNKTIASIEDLFRGNTGGHDAAHSLRVYRNAMKIAETEPEAAAKKPAARFFTRGGNFLSRASGGRRADHRNDRPALCGSPAGRRRPGNLRAHGHPRHRQPRRLTAGHRETFG